MSFSPSSEDLSYFNISKGFFSNEKVGHKYTVSWELLVNGKNTTLKDIFTLEGSHWYGTAQVRSNQWPIEKWSRRQMPYVCGDSFADQWGGVQERYWLNSNGVAIFVEEDVPLFVGLNENGDRTLTLISKWNSPYRNIESKNLHFKYSIIQGNDVRVCHDHVIRHVFAKPSGIPDELMFRFPIWSTWARYKKNINHKTVLEVSICTVQLSITLSIHPISIYPSMHPSIAPDSNTDTNYAHTKSFSLFTAYNTGD